MRDEEEATSRGIGGGAIRVMDTLSLHTDTFA
jgi:hypothetical protein